MAEAVEWSDWSSDEEIFFEENTRVTALDFDQIGDSGHGEASSSQAVDDFADATDSVAPSDQVDSLPTMQDHLLLILTELDELEKPKWDFVKKESGHMINPFTPKRQPGPILQDTNIDHTSSESEFFGLFYTDSFLEKVCNWTNAHAAEDDETSYGPWKDITVDELKAFYAVRTFIEFVCKDRLDSLWQPQHPNKWFLLDMPGVSDVFTYKRYKQIVKYLHYYAPNTAPSQSNPLRDRGFKVRNLIDEMKEHFPKYFECGEHISIDECVIPFQGRLGIKVYFKDKPVKWGIKLWMICDSETGYCHDFDLYSGVDEDFEDLTNVGTTSAVVAKLCKSMCGTSRYVYTDRFYTSPIFAHYLTKLGLQFCGTCMTNRKGLPKDIVVPKSRKEKQGTFDWRQCSQTGVIATRWADKRGIYFISTGYLPEYAGCVVKDMTKPGRSYKFHAPLQ